VASAPGAQFGSANLWRSLTPGEADDNVVYRQQPSQLSELSSGPSFSPHHRRTGLQQGPALFPESQIRVRWRFRGRREAVIGGRHFELRCR
jgi:hypothetical protein